LPKLWDALTLGEFYVDHIFSGLKTWPKPGEEVFTRQYLRELGGGAAITASGLARLGRKTAVFGVIGSAEASWITNRLRRYGVETGTLKIVEAETGVTVSLSKDEERTFFSYLGSNALLEEYLLAPEVLVRLREAAHVHVAVPLQRGVAERLLPELKRAGCTLSLDPGWQPRWYLDPQNLRTCKEVDYFLPNNKEAQALTGQQDPEQVLAGFERLGFSNVVMKLGAGGAAMRIHGRVLQVPSPKTAVVDTTGAGDAFDAGLIDAILDKADPAKMLRRAVACGALSTRSAGGLSGLATRKDLEGIHE
jgi:sugar/nucleoside kinase (ribokinase family)